jgi:hypothetical protein
MCGSRERAYLLFCDSRWWGVRFLRSGFRHVVLVVREGDRCTVYNPGADGVRVVEMGWPPAVDGTLLAVPAGAMCRPLRRYSPLVRFSCVEWCKDVLGLDSRAITPWRLFKEVRG